LNNQGTRADLPGSEPQQMKIYDRQRGEMNLAEAKSKPQGQMSVRYTVLLFQQARVILFQTYHPLILEGRLSQGGQ